MLISFFIYYFISDNGYYKTKNYYVYINSEPQIAYEKEEIGNKTKTYTYKVNDYNNGDSKELDLQFRNKLSENTSYLVKWEDRRGLVSDIKKISLQKFKENK